MPAEWGPQSRFPMRSQCNCSQPHGMLKSAIDCDSEGDCWFRKIPTPGSILCSRKCQVINLLTSTCAVQWQEMESK